MKKTDMEKPNDQMTLFEQSERNVPSPKKPKVRKSPKNKSTQAAARKTTVKVSGLVPEGDVRLTANIRQDLHLKLKIAAAKQRTTIGELIEDLVEKYI